MRRFAIAFLIGLLAVALANVVACVVRSDSYDDPDPMERWGFPFLVSETIMIPDASASYFSRTALWGDISVAILASGLGGWIWSAVKRKTHEI